MSIERTFYCDGPADPNSDEDACCTSATTATPAPYLPEGIIETREKSDQGDVTHYFCGWECLMKFAASQPIPEVIELDE